MYTYIVIRTQIYLTEAIDEVLQQLANETGLTRSELIRRALEATYLDSGDQEAVIRGLEATAGAWSSGPDGAAYVEQRRSGRLVGLHAAESGS